MSQTKPVKDSPIPIHRNLKGYKVEQRGTFPRNQVTTCAGRTSPTCSQPPRTSRTGEEKAPSAAMLMGPFLRLASVIYSYRSSGLSVGQRLLTIELLSVTIVNSTR